MAKKKSRRDTMRKTPKDEVILISGTSVDIDENRDDELQIEKIDMVAMDNELYASRLQLDYDLDDNVLEHMNYTSWSVMTIDERELFSEGLSEEEAEEYWTLLNALGCECQGAQTRKVNHGMKAADFFQEPMYSQERITNAPYKPPVKVRNLNEAREGVEHQMKPCKSDFKFKYN